VYLTELTQDGSYSNCYHSPNVTSLTGYPLEKFQADWSFWPSVVIHPDDRSRAIAQANRLAGGQNSESEYRLVRADGQIIWVRDSACVEDTGATKIIYGIVSNITERKQAQAALEQERALLAQRVNEHTIELQLANVELARAARLKAEFVANISHELRTPLSVLTLLSDNLDSFYDRLSDDKRRKLVRDIQKHTQVLNDLIGDILEISRIDDGRISKEYEPVDLTQIARQEISELSPLAQEKAQLLRLQGHLSLKVWGNPAQLRQVVRNLLNNAIKYTPEGGQIQCETMILSASSPKSEKAWPGRLNLPSARPWAALRVADTGIGIGEEHLPHIFERFYRVKTEQNIRGTGLGLAIVREIVNLHSGYVSVASTPGQGTIFAIYLPLFN
jgi:PAS domain S-box-containing protein